MKIVILGQHGSGKTTLAKLLAKHFGVPALSTGRMFRKMATESTVEGQRVRSAMLAGDYLPDEVVIPLVQDRLRKGDTTKGFILEGYPRTLAQATAFDTPDLVYYLDVPDEVSRRRLLGRQRDDDTAEVIERRLGEYHQEGDEVVAFYQQRGVLRKLDAQQPPQRVFEQAIQP